MANEVIKKVDSCGLGKIIGMIFLTVSPVFDERKAIDTITEDAEFEVVEPKMLEQQKSHDDI